LKDIHICINFRFELRITARPQFVTIHKPNKSPLSGKCGLLYKRKKASPVEHQKNVGDLSFDCVGIVSILFVQAKWLTILLLGGLATFEGSSVAKISGTMVGRFTNILCSNFWPNENMSVVPYPPYSPDIAPVFSSCYHE